MQAMNDFSDVDRWQVADRDGASLEQQAAARRDGRDPVSGARSLTVERQAEVVKGWGIFGWLSPELRLEPGRCYRFSCRLRSTVRATWEAQFCIGEPPAVDDLYTGALPDTGGAWLDEEHFFHGKQAKESARIVVWPSGRGTIELACPQLRPASEEEARRSYHATLDAMPPLPPETDADAGRLLPRALERLRRGGPQPVGVMTYGDSVAFDMGNSPLETALIEAWPGARIAFHTRGRGGTGWGRLGEPAELAELVLSRRPQVVITANVCTPVEEIGPTLGAVIDRVRDGCGAELVLATNAVLVNAQGDDRHERMADAVRRLAHEKQCELADLRAFLRGYLAAHGLPLTWHLRDAVHLSNQGKALATRFLLRHLAPGRTQ